MNESAQEASRATRTLPSLIEAGVDEDTGPATPFTPRTCAVLARVRLRMRWAAFFAAVWGTMVRWAARIG